MVRRSSDNLPAPGRSRSPTDPSPGTLARRRAVTLFVIAGLAVALALTVRWWLPALPTLFGTIEANRELIGAFADLTTIAEVAISLIVVILVYLGFRSLQGSSAGGEARQAVEVARGGRGVAVGGDVNHGAVFVGDNNQVSFEVSEDVIYNYADATPSSPNRGELEEARRRLEELPLEEVGLELRRFSGQLKMQDRDRRGGGPHADERGDFLPRISGGNGSALPFLRVGLPGGCQ